MVVRFDFLAYAGLEFKRLQGALHPAQSRPGLDLVADDRNHAHLNRLFTGELNVHRVFFRHSADAPFRPGACHGRRACLSWR